MDHLPQARVVRKGGQLMAPPPEPQQPSKLVAAGRSFLEHAIGMWPLTGVLLLTFGLLLLVQVSKGY